MGTGIEIDFFGHHLLGAGFVGDEEVLDGGVIGGLVGEGEVFGAD